MKINIIGAGLMARQIAALFALGSFEIYIWNRSGVDEKAFQRQAKILQRKFSFRGEAKFIIKKNIEELPQALTIESISESLEDKRQIYKAVRILNQEPYFSNTSSFSPCEIGEDVGGLHFFNPIDLKLIELYAPESVALDDKRVERIVGFLDKLGFTVVNANANRGYIGNYILFLEISNVFKLVEKYGYSYSEIEKVYKTLFMGRDVISILDVVGIDVSLQIIKNLNEKDSSVYIPSILKRAIDHGVLGRKNKTSLRDFL